MNNNYAYSQSVHYAKIYDFEHSFSKFELDEITELFTRYFENLPFYTSQRQINLTTKLIVDSFRTGKRLATKGNEAIKIEFNKPN